MKLFLGWFENERDVEKEFQLAENSLNDVNILLAWYGGDGYDGSAFVLFERNGKLYEVNGGHCSCYGLEEQWDPEETFVPALMHRINEGSLGQDSYYDEGIFGTELLEILENQN